MVVDVFDLEAFEAFVYDHPMFEQEVLVLVVMVVVSYFQLADVVPVVFGVVVRPLVVLQVEDILDPLVEVDLHQLAWVYPEALLLLVVALVLEVEVFQQVETHLEVALKAVVALHWLLVDPLQVVVVHQLKVLPHLEAVVFLGLLVFVHLDQAMHLIPC